MSIEEELTGQYQLVHRIPCMFNTENLPTGLSSDQIKHLATNKLQSAAKQNGAATSPRSVRSARLDKISNQA